MILRFRFLTVVFLILVAGSPFLTAGETNKDRLLLAVEQENYLRVEPVLVTVCLEGKGISLPAGPGKAEHGTLAFEIEPSVKQRKNAKPLPLEGAKEASSVGCRNYDLLEWYELPTGTFRVVAVVTFQGQTLRSQPITFSISAADKTSFEHGATGRIHHLPWTNYDTNAFCGDTFDLVKSWPKSRLIKYCQYWNGRFQQNKGEFAEAIKHFEVVVRQFPNSALADDAAFGVVECLVGLKKNDEARKYNSELVIRLVAEARKSGRTSRTVVQHLSQEMTRKLSGAK